ncbi:MAG: hypothetical protein ABH817_02345 [archaeon]
MAVKKKEVNKTENTDKLLLNNFVQLQKKLTEIALELKDVNNKLVKLSGQEHKIDSLMDQVQTVAKGVILLEKAVRVKPLIHQPKIVSKKPAKEEDEEDWNESMGDDEDYETQPLPEFSF